MGAIFVKLVLVALIGGDTFIAGRVAAPEMSATTAALCCYIVATVALLAMVGVREGGLPRLSGGQRAGVILLGVTGVAAYNLCSMYGLESVPASRGALIIALNSAATMLGAAFFLHEPLTLAKIGGTALALSGVAIELGGGNPLALFNGGAGELALFGCAVAWAALVPVAAIALGVLLLGERITPAMLVGACLVVAGVWIINRPTPAATAPAVLRPHG